MTKHKPQKAVVFYFQVHQPYRLNDYNYFQEKANLVEGPTNATNEQIFEKVANKCYLPANKMMLKLLQKYPEFKICFSLSGVFLEQCLQFGKIGAAVLKSFQDLVATGQVELLSETYYHSLTFLFSKEEYSEQILKHRKLINKLFGVKTKIFRNTELIYNNEIANFIKAMGFEGILLEGWDPVLLGQKQHHVMQPVTTGLHAEDFRIAREKAIGPVREDFGLLLKDYKLSDDIAFRFGNQAWSEFPLQTDKYVNWLKQIVGESINLFMDYETFGEHQWEETGIFKFMEDLPAKVLAAEISFLTPSEALKTFPRRGEINCHQHLSWADQERDLSAWTGNQLQDSCLESISGLEKKLHQFKNSRKKNWREVVELWRKMQTSDHFYYMCLKYWQDGDVHKYFSPYQSPYEAYIAYMNVFARLKEKVELLLQNEK